MFLRRLDDSVVSPAVSEGTGRWVDDMLRTCWSCVGFVGFDGDVLRGDGEYVMVGEPPRFRLIAFVTLDVAASLDTWSNCISTCLLMIFLVAEAIASNSARRRRPDMTKMTKMAKMMI